MSETSHCFSEKNLSSATVKGTQLTQPAVSQPASVISPGKVVAVLAGIRDG